MSSARVYGLVSYLVSQRTREIAIRAAIGAQQRSLCWLVARQTVVSTCLGVAVGLAAAVALTGLLTRFAVIGRLDLPILAGIAILHLAIVVAATYVPARRAFQLDAMRALGTN